MKIILIVRIPNFRGDGTSASVCKMKQSNFWIHFPDEIFKITKINNFQGDITDISVKIKRLDLTLVCLLEQPCPSSREPPLSQ